MKAYSNALPVRGTWWGESVYLPEKTGRDGIQNRGLRFALVRKRFTSTILIKEEEGERCSDADKFITLVRGS